ncbi:uncharacterized mitochondrial protein AtMg00860-like [Carya illinoinensis]|uniref:uncharacterized mitochondrial protein AtMg00860-like n=1 Tax=Carya illinoinensis TaxID=32201 RepID=UPI001C7246F3|nr:uncharacterized mitochondrial protein AtMg00860-like [Carya illinoinensis]
MDEATHLTHLRLTLEKFRENQLFAKFSKCSFFYVEISYLGHLISAHGVKADPEKVRAMIEWPTPHSLKSSRGFLGFTVYYWRYIKGYGSIVAKLKNLLRKDNFKWDVEAYWALDQLKAKLTQPLVLALHNFQSPFIVECDAFDEAMGAVLLQGGRLLAFYSQALKGKLLLLSTYKKELLALVLALKKWQSYLLGQSFVVDLVHSSPMGEHLDFDKTVYKLKHDFYWPGPKTYVGIFLKGCETCQTVKVDNTLPSGLL